MGGVVVFKSKEKLLLEGWEQTSDRTLFKSGYLVIMNEMMEDFNKPINITYSKDDNSFHKPIKTGSYIVYPCQFESLQSWEGSIPRELAELQWNQEMREILDNDEETK